MPTPVKTAKQCLNPEASQALQEAVSIARRRKHPQTTSLHVVSSLLFKSPSQLKQACIRARNTSFCNPKVQLKALEFCLSMSLDRLPISQLCLDEPHVSNSLMAAIKRSQANQRRHPDCIMAVKSCKLVEMGSCQDVNFGSISSSCGVKVDLQHLIVSILDDPIVSRVFNDAGFSSFDVKLAVLRPFSSLYRYPDPGFSRVRFPFSGSWDEEGECKRILELLRRKKGRNPLLVGVSANEVLKSFVEVLEKKKGFLPMDICGIIAVSIEEELAKLGTAKLSYDAIEGRFNEVGLMVDQCLGPGLIVNVGNVRCFLGKEEEGYEMEVVNCIVRKLSKLLEVHRGRVWLIGSAANDQTYMEFLSRFPLIDKEWDLQLLPITSIKPSMSSMGEPCYKSSLMRSFVPFGGFFSNPPDPKGLLSSSFQNDTRCNIFDVTSLSKRVVTDLGADSALDYLKAKRGAILLSGTVTDVQRNSEDMSACQNHDQASPKPDSWQPPIIKQAYVGSLTNDNFLAKLSRTPSKNQQFCEDGSCSPHSLCISGADNSQTSPSGVSVITDLGLGLHSQVSKQQKKFNAIVDDGYHLVKPLNHPSLSFTVQDANNLKELFKALFERVGRQHEALRVVSQIVSQSWISNGCHQRGGLRGDIWLNFIGPDVFGKRKTAVSLAEILYGSKKYLIHVNLCSDNMVAYQKKVFGYQIVNGFDAKARGKTIIDRIAEELRKTPFSVVLLENAHLADPLAQNSLLQAIRNGKFSDSYGREVSLTNRVFVLTSRLIEDSSTNSSMEKPSKFCEARMERAKGCPLQLVMKGDGDYKTRQNSFILGPEKNVTNQTFWCKRKFNSTHETFRPKIHKGTSMSLDLNLPAEITEEDDTNFCDFDKEFECESVRSWLDDISNQGLDKTVVKVVFDPYDYDAMAEKILKWVHASFLKSTNSNCVLEIEPRTMDQIMAAACLSQTDKEIEDWIELVLGKSFAEVQKRHQLTCHSIVMLTTFEGDALSTNDKVGGVYLPSIVYVA